MVAALPSHVNGVLSAVTGWSMLVAVLMLMSCARVCAFEDMMRALVVLVLSSRPWLEPRYHVRMRADESRAIGIESV